MERGQHPKLRYWPSPVQSRPLLDSKTEFNGVGGLRTHIRIVPFPPVRHDPKTASAPHAGAVALIAVQGSGRWGPRDGCCAMASGDGADRCGCRNRRRRGVARWELISRCPARWQAMPERAEMVCKPDVTRCHHGLPIGCSLQKLPVISMGRI